MPLLYIRKTGAVKNGHVPPVAGLRKYAIFSYCQFGLTLTPAHSTGSPV